MLLTAASTSESRVQIPFNARMCVNLFPYYAVWTDTKQNFMSENSELK